MPATAWQPSVQMWEQAGGATHPHAAPPVDTLLTALAQQAANTTQLAAPLAPQPPRPLKPVPRRPDAGAHRAADPQPVFRRAVGAGSGADRAGSAASAAAAVATPSRTQLSAMMASFSAVPAGDRQQIALVLKQVADQLDQAARAAASAALLQRAMPARQRAAAAGLSWPPPWSSWNRCASRWRQQLHAEPLVSPFASRPSSAPPGLAHPSAALQPFASAPLLSGMMSLEAAWPCRWQQRRQRRQRVHVLCAAAAAPTGAAAAAEPAGAGAGPRRSLAAQLTRIRGPAPELTLEPALDPGPRAHGCHRGSAAVAPRHRSQCISIAARARPLLPERAVLSAVVYWEALTPEIFLLASASSAGPSPQQYYQLASSPFRCTPTNKKRAGRLPPLSSPVHSLFFP